MRYWSVRNEMPSLSAARFLFPPVSARTFRMISFSFARRKPPADGSRSVGPFEAQDVRINNVPRKDHGPLDDVLQLPDVAGPP
jgi:hypothetical protein